MRIYTKVEEPAAVTVLMPYVKANHRLQLVVDCLRIQQVQPRLEKVDDGDAYWRLLSGMWALGEEFFVVEHDVAVWMGAIRQLKECPEDWCTLPTLCHGRMITTTFGCIKFGQRLIERRPGFWDDIPTTWFHLDANFTDKMGWPFIKPHAHFPRPPTSTRCSGPTRSRCATPSNASSHGSRLRRDVLSRKCSSEWRGIHVNFSVAVGVNMCPQQRCLGTVLRSPQAT